MANEDNLLKMCDLTPEQRRENARKAGIASGKKRTQRAMFKKMLQASIENKTIKEELKKAKMGKTYNDAMIYNIVNLAMNAPDGLTAIKAADLILKAIGEDKPQEEINLNAINEHNESIQEFSLKNNGQPPMRHIEDFEDEDDSREI